MYFPSITKQEWSNRVDRIVKKYRMKYNQSFESIQRVISDACESAVMPNHTAAFMELVGSDPDTHFSGVTNWYYAGGRLSYVTVDGQMVLLTSGGGRNEKLFAIPLTEHIETGWQPALRASTKEQTTANEAILEIVGRSNDSSGLIGVRQRNLCSVYMLMPQDGSFQLCGIHRATSEQHPFTSMQFSPRDYGLYCTASVNRQVSLWDAQSCNCIASDVVEKPDCHLSSSWSGVQFQDSSGANLLMADVGSLSWLDARIGLSKPTARFCLKDEPSLLSPCEDISLVVPGSSLYIATSHHLLHYEPRTGHILQRWTHLLRSPPLYGQSVAWAGRHMICLANQEPAEVALIVSDSVATSTLLPYGLPTLPETLHCCQMRGQLLDPRAQQRLNVSVAGVLCLPLYDEDSYQILTQTVLGDVFIQDLRKSKPVAEQSSCYDDRINVWNDECLKTVSTKASEITGEKNYKSAFDNLQNPDLKMRPYDRTFLLQESLRISKGELFCYKDMLAPELLAAWNVESIPEWGESAVTSGDTLDLSTVSCGGDEQHCTDATLPSVSELAVATSGSLSHPHHSVDPSHSLSHPYHLVDPSHSPSLSHPHHLVDPSHSPSLSHPHHLVDPSLSLSSLAELPSQTGGSQQLNPSIRPIISKPSLNKSNEIAMKRRSNVSGF